MTRIFLYPDCKSYVIFTESVLEYMYAHAQRRLWQREAGGEIFSISPNSKGLVVTKATGPNRRDYRRRCAWNPNIVESDLNRKIHFSSGHHAVGLWHTHPERYPMPSQQDSKTTWEYLDAFQGDRFRYFMVIIGNRGIVPMMTVCVAERKKEMAWIYLTESDFL